MNAERMKFAGITMEDFVVTQEILVKSPMSLRLRSKRQNCLWGFLSIILKRQHQLQPKANTTCVQLTFIRFCFSAAASALYQTSFAGSCLTPWCTNTWASAQTDQCPRISSRFRQPLFSLILSTHSGSSLETRMENFTWEWVLAALGPWAGHENLWCHQGVTLVPFCQTHQVSLEEHRSILKGIGFLIPPY